jgi:23S rRNA (guanosine2251-2'-O)-methyltransferase
VTPPPGGRRQPPKGAPRRQPPRSGAPERRPEPRRADKGLGGDQVEGRRAVRELLAAGKRRVKEVWLAEGSDPAEILVEIVDLAEANRVPVRVVARARLDGAAVTEAPQGVLARAEALAETDLERLARPVEGRPAFLLAVDGVTDPHNLGALLRSAEVAGVTGVILPRHRTVHVTPTVAKAAAGAIEHLRFALVPGLPAALSALRSAGVWTVGLAAESATSIYQLEVATEPLALVVGSEGEGLSRLTAQRCEVLAGIPQHGRLESLNVSAAGAVALFEVARRRGAV